MTLTSGHDLHSDSGWSTFQGAMDIGEYMERWCLCRRCVGVELLEDLTSSGEFFTALTGVDVLGEVGDGASFSYFTRLSMARRRLDRGCDLASALR